MNDKSEGDRDCLVIVWRMGWFGSVGWLVGLYSFVHGEDTTTRHAKTIYVFPVVFSLLSLCSGEARRSPSRFPLPFRIIFLLFLRFSALWRPGRATATGGWRGEWGSRLLWRLQQGRLDGDGGSRFGMAYDAGIPMSRASVTEESSLSPSLSDGLVSHCLLPLSYLLSVFLVRSFPSLLQAFL